MVILRQADVTFLQDWERICRGEVSVSDIAVVFTHQHTEFIYLAVGYGKVAVAHVSPHEFFQARPSYVIHASFRPKACVSSPQTRRVMAHPSMISMTKAAHRLRNDPFRVCPYARFQLWRATCSSPLSAASNSPEIGSTSPGMHEVYRLVSSFTMIPKPLCLFPTVQHVCPQKSLLVSPMML